MNKFEMIYFLNYIKITPIGVSILKWQDIYLSIKNSDFPMIEFDMTDLSSDSCALCFMFKENRFYFHKNCTGCPLVRLKQSCITNKRSIYRKIANFRNRRFNIYTLFPKMYKNKLLKLIQEMIDTLYKCYFVELYEKRS